MEIRNQHIDVNRMTEQVSHKRSKKANDKKDAAPQMPVDSVSKGEPETRSVKLSIIHTNDVHGHLDAFREKGSPDKIGGLSNLASKIKEEKAKNPENSLLLDAGDISTGGPVSDYFKAIPIVDSMNALGYDAMAVGNHEFDQGRNALGEIINKADFPVLSANLVDKSNEPVKVKPWVMKEVGGLKVGILGLTTPEAEAMLVPSDKGVIKLKPAITTARRNLRQMKKAGADLVVVLSHLGKDQDVRLAKAVGGIDVIVGGHSHSEIKEPLRVKDTIITQTGKFGSNVGRLDLDVEVKNGKAKVKKSGSKLIPIREGKISKDRDVSNILKFYNEKLGPIMKRKIGKTMVDLSQRDYHIHKEESPLANFVADTMRKETGADISFISPSSLRTNIPKGEITVGKIYELFPWMNKVSVLKIAGHNIRKALSEALEGPAYGFSVSGLKVEIDTSKPTGEKVLKITMPDGKPLEGNKEYRVATRDWFADGNVGIKSLTRYHERKDTKDDLRQIIIKNIENQKEVYAGVDGRITNRAVFPEDVA